MGKQSTIKQLPTDILEQLQALLRDPRVTQCEATEQINAILAAQGHDDRLSKSAVNRYSLQMEKVGSRLRQSREVAEMWIAKLGAQPSGQVGHLLNEMVRTLAFEAVMRMSEDDEPVEPKLLKDLSIAIERLERASTENVKRETEIRKQVLSEAAEAVSAAGKQGGVSVETVEMIRKQILGIGQ